MKRVWAANDENWQACAGELFKSQGGSKQRCSSGKVTSSRDQHHRMAAVSGGSKTSEEMRGDQLVTVLSYYWNNRLFLM